MTVRNRTRSELIRDVSLCSERRAGIRADGSGRVTKIADEQA